MNNLRFITSFTQNTDEEKIVNKCLIPSLEKFNLPYHLYSQSKSTSYVYSILQSLNQFPDENIIYLDYRAEVMAHPDVLFRIPDYCQIGANFLWKNEHEGIKNENSYTLVDKTLYFKNNEIVRKYIEEWGENVEDNQPPNNALDTLIKIKSDEINLFLIPRAYCYLVQKRSGELPEIPINNSRINHY
jgi:hypothetical protein